jgi:diguanylate cyclase
MLRLWHAIQCLSGSLKARLIFTMLIATWGGVFFATYLLELRTVQSIMSSAAAQEQTEVQRSARAAADFISHKHELLDLMAQQIDASIWNNAEKLQQTVSSKHVFLQVFDTLQILDARGQRRLLFRGNHRETQFDKPYPYAPPPRGFGQDLPTVSNTLSSLILNQPIVHLSYPIWVNGQVVGSVVGGVRLYDRKLFASLTQAEGSEPSNITFITDSNGKFVAHPDYLLVGKHIDQEHRIRSQTQLPEHTGDELIQSFDEREGGETLVTSVGIRGSQWRMWRLSSTKQILEPLYQARAETYFFAAVVSVALSVFGFLWLQRMLKPLHSLTQAAQSFVNGPLDKVVWPKADGEIGELTKALHLFTEHRDMLKSRNEATMLQLSAVMQAAPTAICFTRNRCFEVVSESFAQLFGAPQAFWKNRLAQEIYADQSTYEALGERVRKCFGQQMPFDEEVPMRRANDEMFWARLRGQPVGWNDMSAGTIWSVEDVSSQRLRNEQLEKAALLDPLTEVANRTFFGRELDSLLMEPRLARATSLVLFDLDRFKSINDQFGHAAGDALLCEVAKTVQGCIRRDDLLARLGGDEFAVLLRGCDSAVAQRIALQILHDINTIRIPWQNSFLTVGVSIGVAPYADLFKQAADWVNAADMASYQAKARGGRDIVVARVDPTIRPTLVKERA